MTATMSGTDADRGHPLSSYERARFPTLVFIAAVVAAVVAASASYIAYGHYHPVYQSAAAVTFDQPRAVALSNDAGELQKLAALRVQYGGLLRTDVISGPVAQSLGLPQGVVATALAARVPTDSLVLTVVAQTRDRDLAVRIADATAKQVITYVTDVQDQAGVAQKNQVIAQEVVQPRFAAQVAPTSKRRASVAVLAGIVVLGLVLGVAAVVRRRRA